MRMNGDQEGRAGKMVAVSLGLGSVRPSWRVMRGRSIHHQRQLFLLSFLLLAGISFSFSQVSKFSYRNIHKQKEEKCQGKMFPG